MRLTQEKTNLDFVFLYVGMSAFQSDSLAYETST